MLSVLAHITESSSRRYGLVFRRHSIRRVVQCLTDLLRAMLEEVGHVSFAVYAEEVKPDYTLATVRHPDE